MNVLELKERFKSESLMIVTDNNIEKNYVDANKVWINNSWSNMINVFGIYKDDQAEYYVFITDEERGIPKYNRKFQTEEEACDCLYKKVVILKRMQG